MKTKILLMIIGTILCLSLILAGGISIMTKTTTINETDKTILIDKGIDNIKVSRITCNARACSYWITGKGIRKQEGISLTRIVCSKINKSDCVTVNVTKYRLDKIREERVNEILKQLANSNKAIKNKSLNATNRSNQYYVIINDKVAIK
jgi:hypothetical protein